jgi:hypothetical protein
MDRARRELDAASPREVGFRSGVHRAANAPGWARCLWICAVFAVLLLLTIPIKQLDLDFWSHLAPTDSGGTLATLWQVQAGLVTLGFPLLLLLIQFSRDDSVTALRSSEVLARETFARAAMEFSAVGLIAAGALAAWLVSDGAVIVAILFITVPTVALLLRSYFVALDLHMNRAQLRRKSSELLQEKLRSSMRDLWLTQHANALLLEGLAPLGASRGYASLDGAYEGWWSVTAPRSGRITDVDLQGLRSLLAALPAAGQGAASDASLRQSEPPLGGGESPRMHVLRFCGDHVHRGEPVMVLRRDAFALGADPLLPMDRVLRIETDET